MPQSYTGLYYHIIFSTLYRKPLIPSATRQRIYDYIGGIIKAEKGTLIDANGPANHVHLVAEFSKERSVADMLQKIKSNSSGWIHRTFPELQHFAWQTGYSAYTVRYEDIPRLREYLANQEAHHRKVSFEEEVIAFFQRYNIAYDEKYLFE